MKYLTSGDIHRMFKQEDEGTIIRRNNVRRIALENGIKNTLTQNIILIDSTDFFAKVNPYNIQEHEYKIPKVRCIKDCARGGITIERQATVLYTPMKYVIF